MPAHAMFEDLHLTVVRGGRLTCAPATDARERAQLCTLAWGVSRVLGGDTVRVQDHLPGLHLDIRVSHLLDALPWDPTSAPVSPQNIGCAHVERHLKDMLEWPARRRTSHLADWTLACAIHQGDAPDDGTQPIAFTLQCQWPGVLGGYTR